MFRKTKVASARHDDHTPTGWVSTSRVITAKSTYDGLVVTTVFSSEK